MNRLIKRKNLFALLFAVLLALPMCAILGRVLYTQCNKNAKDSYSLDLSQNYNLVNTDTTLQGTQYQIVFTKDMLQGNSLPYVYTNQITFVTGTADIPTNLQFFRVYYNVNANSYSLQLVGDTTTYTILSANATSITSAKTFNFISTQNGTYTTSYQSGLYRFQYQNDNTLDNAFEYSVNKFIDDNNFGKLDFFQWFNNMFLDSNNSVNNMYVHFVNWYLNYALLISLAYILFLVLMWFINYVRKLLEKGMDFGEGSY